MEEVTLLSWESMCRFLEHNRGLIVTICRQYKVNPNNTLHHQEDAFIEAVKSYDPLKPTKKYSLSNHFGNILKSKVKQDITQANKTIYLETIDFSCDSATEEDCHCSDSLIIDISGQKQWKQWNADEDADLEAKRRLLALIQDSAKKHGKGTYKKVVNYILLDDIQSAVAVIPECREVILEIAKRRKKGGGR